MQSRTPFLLVLALILIGTSPQDKTPKAQPKPQPTPQPSQPAEENPYVKRFEELDRDKDGYISLAEWPLDPDSYRRVDRNQDGRLSRGELLTPNVLRTDPIQQFRAMDTNGDGRLSPAERQREGTVLDRLDRNKDGYVTLREYDDSRNIGNTWNPRAGIRDQQRYQTLDRNRDNRLTRPEWTGGGARFQQLDRNGDGVITPSEWPG